MPHELIHTLLILILAAHQLHSAHQSALETKKGHQAATLHHSPICVHPR